MTKETAEYLKKKGWTGLAEMIEPSKTTEELIAKMAIDYFECSLKGMGVDDFAADFEKIAKAAKEEAWREERERIMKELPRQSDLQGIYVAGWNACVLAIKQIINKPE